MTVEGTIRGYQSQCADVAKTLQSVRAMVKSGHAVCFGLGEKGEDHIIVNKMSGEVNRMHDDGINYIQKLTIIPQDQVEAVVSMMTAPNMPPPQQNNQGFVGRGR